MLFAVVLRGALLPAVCPDVAVCCLFVRSRLLLGDVCIRCCLWLVVAVCWSVVFVGVRCVMAAVYDCCVAVVCRSLLVVVGVGVGCWLLLRVVVRRCMSLFEVCCCLVLLYSEVAVCWSCLHVDVVVRCCCSLLMCVVCCCGLLLAAGCCLLFAGGVCRVMMLFVGCCVLCDVVVSCVVLLFACCCLLAGVSCPRVCSVPSSLRLSVVSGLLALAIAVC